MPRTSHIVARLHGEADHEIERLRAERDALRDAARDLLMHHDRGYFGRALKVEDRDCAAIASLRDAVESVRP